VILMANAGVPMIFVIWPATWLLLIPIVLVEWALACRILKVPSLDGFLAACIGNLASTVVALPVTWVLMLIVALITPNSTLDSFWGVFNNVVLHSAWLLPLPAGGGWMVPAAALALCVPFFLASVGTERLIAGWTLRSKHPQARIGRWAWTANAVTYGAIMTGLGGILVYELTKRRPDGV
jgi:hypothetical protein